MAEEIQVEEIQPADITEQELQQNPMPDVSGSMTIDLIYPKISSDLFEQNLRRNPEEEGYPQGTTAIKLLALDTAFALRQKNPSLFEENEDPYKALALGQARFLPENERNKQITDEEIIRRYLRNPDNKPMREGSFAKGFAKQIGPSVAGLGGFVGGVKAGYAMQTAIPPAPHPFVVGAKFLIPVATGIAGQIAGEEGVEALRDYFFGAPDLVDPERGGGMERVGETAAVATSFIPLPYLTAKEAISFGGKEAVEAITRTKMDKLRDTLEVGPVPKAVSEAVFKEAARKPPRSTRFIAKTEEMIPKMGQRASTNRIFTAGEELSFAAGATGGRYLSEEYFEGEGSFPLEMAGGVSVGLTLPYVIGAPYFFIKNFDAVVGGLKKFGSAINPFDKEVPLSSLFSRKGQEQAYVDVVNIIEERLKEAGEDPEKIAEAIEKIANDPQFREFTAATITQSPVLLRIEHEMAGLFPDLKAQGQEGVKKAIDNYKQMLVAYAMIGDAAALRQVENAFQETMERALIDKLDQSASRVLEAARRVGTGETDVAVGTALQKTLTNALTAARAKERFLYSNLPEADINVFRAFPVEGEEVGEVIRLPNLFNFVDRLPASRTGLKFLPAQIKQQVSYIIEILDNAGVDTSRLGKRGFDAGDSNPSETRTRVESTLASLGRRRQTILDNMSQYTKNAMVNLLDLVSNSPRFGGMTPEEQILAVERDLSAIDTLIEAARGRRNIPEDEFRTAELQQIQSLLRNRMAAARARLELAEVGRGASQRTPEEVDADEILDLRTLIEELRMSDQPISISSRFLTEMRSKALSANRELTAAQKYDEAGMAKRMADLVDQDLTGAIDDITGVDAKASITAARAFSRALNDVFTRAFAPSILLGTKSTGAATLSPEEAVRTLFSGRSDRVLRNTKEISRVGQFLRDDVNPDIELTDLKVDEIDVGRLVNDVPDVLERALRNIRGTVLRPREGADAAQELELNTRELKAWLEDPNNQQLLAMFPKRLADDLNDVDAAYELLNTARNQANLSRKDARERLSFKRLVAKGDETPSATISGALGSERPEYELNQIWRTIANARVTDVTKEVREEARESLKTGLMDWAIARSSNRNGDLNPKQMYDSLFAPVKPGSSITLAEWMQSKNLLGAEDFKAIEKYLAEMTALQSLLTKEGLDELLKQGGSPLRDLALRIIGAKMGTSVSGLIGGSEASLIAAQAGSAALRALFVSKSGVNNMKAFKELLSDPQFLAKMLKTPRDKRQAKSMWQLARDWMLSKGFVLGRRAYAVEQTEPEEFEGLPPRTREELAQKTGRFEMLPVSLPKTSSLNAGSTPPVIRQPRTTAPEPRTTDPERENLWSRVLQQESGNRQVDDQGRIMTSRVGALGVAQVMPPTAAVPGYNAPNIFRVALSLGVPINAKDQKDLDRLLTLTVEEDSEGNKIPLASKDLQEAKRLLGIKEVNEAFGRKYFDAMYSYFDGDPVRTLIAYNAGPDYAKKYNGDPATLPDETQNYLVKILGVAQAPAPKETPPLAQAAPPPMPPAAPAPAPITPQSLQRTAQVLGPNDEIGMLASELMMRQGPA